MAFWHSYIGIENLGLNQSQRQTLIAELKTLGPTSDPQPARLNHWRMRLDNEAAIFEALFNEDNLTIQKFKERLANLYGVDPDDITHQASNQSFAGGTTTVIDFTYNKAKRLQFALFGGQGCEWMESGDECRGYLAQYRDEWEGAA